MRLFLLLPVLVMTCFFSSAQTGISILTQHNDINRTGWNNKETILTPTNVTAGQFGRIGTFNVDDEVYAQPLIVNNITVGNHTGSVLYTATVNNTVYAFDADDATDTAYLWKVSLNPTGQRAPNTADLQDSQSGAPCGGNYLDFSGRFGIVGTPVIDTASNTLYVATKTIDNNGNFYAYINALDLTTGQQKSGSPHLMTAQVNGTGTGSVNGQVSYQAKFQNQRPALLLYNNVVYVASASYCDWGPYHGWVLGFDANTLALKYTYCTTPNGGGGGIWMAGEGISVGKDGNLYVVTGNGSTTEDNTNPGARGSSLIKLTPGLTQLDWFTPANYAYLNQNDLDYGCDGVLMIPNSTTTISGSKEGISYVVDYNSMGHFNSTNSQVKDTLEFNPNRLGYVHVHGSPVYAQLNGSEFVYGWSESFNLRQFTFDRNTGTFLNTYKQGTRTLDNGMPGAMLSLSSNGADTSSAIVWACFPTSGNANHQVRPGTFAAYRANDVSTNELWNSDQNPNDVIGNFAKFNTPTIANGKVFVPTFSKAIKIYGIFPPDTAKCISNGTGLLAEYFSNTPSTAPFPSTATVTKTEPTINFNWGRGGPSGISVDSFKAKFTGTVQSLDAGAYTFYVTSDDGFRLWINNQLVIDKWIDKSASEDSATITLPRCTKNFIKLEYYENKYDAVCILKWSGPGIAKQVIPAIQLYPADSTKCISSGTGLLAEYFSNTPSTAPFPSTATVTKTEPTIDFNWGRSGPSGISVDSFKVRFTGTVQSLDSGKYTFYVTSDDGFRLWINNQLVIDKWIDKSASEDSATITLLGCTKNFIKLEYYENKYDAVCILKWSGPGMLKQVIPALQLYPPDSPVVCGDPTGLTSSNVTTNSATVSWTGVSGATSYSVDYELTTLGNWINVASATSSTAVTLSGLNQSSTYDWRVKATCSGGSGNYVQAQFTTLAQTSCNAPSNSGSSSITSGGATISWTAVSGALSYDVDYSLSGQNSWTPAATAASSTSVNITGLNSSTAYDWRVRSNCSSTSSSGYSTGSFTTLASITCNAPTSLNTASITSSGATVSWAAASGALSYDIQYGGSGSGPWTTVNTTSTSVNIKGLSASTLYYWQVRTNCSSGSSGYTASQFTTLAVGCIDQLEPNDALATAKAISVGTNLNAEIASASDVDYYIFSTSGSQKNVKVTITNLPANYNLTLYNSKGSQLATSTNAGISNETVVYSTNKAGTYYVKVYGATLGDYSSTQCYTLQVLTSNTTFTANIAGIINNTAISNAGLKLYPIPASSEITISFDALVAGKATVTIINQLGQEVYNKQVDISGGTNINNINLSKLASGIYMLKLKTIENIQSRKLIISK